MNALDHATDRDALLSRLQLLNVGIMQASLNADRLRRRALVRERSQLRAMLERGGVAVAA